MNHLSPVRRLIGAALVAICVVAGAGPAVAQEASADDEAAVRALIVQFYQAYGKEDLAGIKGLWSARVPGLDRLMAAFQPTLGGKDFSFTDVAVSRIDVKPIVASARVTVDATIVDAVSKETAHERWVRNFTLVKDAEGWRVWRDASAAEDTAIEIRGASTAAQAASIVEREPGLTTGEVSQALFGLGNRFRNSGRVEDARETYRLSEQVAERSGNPVVVAQSRTNVGVNSQMTGDYDRALESFQQALALLEPTGDKARIAGAESNVASALYLKKRYPEAIERYQRALAYFESVDHKAAMASALHGIGNAQYLANDFSAALASYQRALALEESSGDAAAAANTLQAIGMVQKEQGDYDAALESYTGSLTRHEKFGNKAGSGVVLASLGDVHRLMGDFSRALERYFQSLPLLEEMGDKETLASTFVDIAGVYAAERRYPQALEFFAKGLPAFEKSGNKSEIARVAAGTGAVYFAQAKYDLAMAQYRAEPAVVPGSEEQPGIAWTLVHMGLVHQAEGRFNDAHAAYEKCLAIVEGLKDRASIAVALALLARTKASLDRPHEALAVARQAAEVAAEIGELDTLARAHLVAGEIGVQLEDTTQARQAYANAVAALEQLQMQGAGAERDRFFGDTLAPFLGLVRLSVTGGKPDDALAWLERGKAYLLRNIIGGSGAIVTKGMTDAERADERRLARRLVSLTTQVRRERGREAPDQARLERLQADLEQTRVEKAAFATALYEAHPTLKVLRAQSDPVASGDKAGLPLPASSAVLEFAVSETSTYLFVIKAVRPPTRSAGSPQPASLRVDRTPKPEGVASPGVSVNVHVLDVKAVDLAAKIAQFRLLITRKGAGADAAARELYDLLLKPAETEFAGATRVIVVPDAVTWALPFQALQPKDGRFLIEDRAVSYAASLASFVEMTRESAANRPPGRGAADCHGVRGRLARKSRVRAAGVSAPGCEDRRRTGGAPGSSGGSPSVRSGARQVLRRRCGHQDAPDVRCARCGHPAHGDAGRAERFEPHDVPDRARPRRRRWPG